MSSAALEGAHARWACMLHAHDLDIVHRPRTLDNIADIIDALSRMSLPSNVDTTGSGHDHDAAVQCATLFQTPSNTAFHAAVSTGMPDLRGDWVKASFGTEPPELIPVLIKGLSY